ncbi:MAG: hypothetical protein DDT19_02259 [Syntrophomonadaceae bacterium]|nr:hypothetical protein [Bacillota bacterium]
MIQSYRDLDVYKRSYQLALEIHRLSTQLPDSERYHLSSQIRRAAVSVPLNIAEGYGRKNSEAEFKHFLRNSLGSCNEVSVLVDMLKDMGYIGEDQHRLLSEEYSVLGKQLNKLIQTWRTI